MLQFPSGAALDCWSMVTPEEELLILRQFLRFGETRAIVDLMAPARFSTAEDSGGSDLLTRADSWLVVSSCGFRGPGAGGPRSERSAGASAPLLTSPVPRLVPALKEAFPVQGPSRCPQAREGGGHDPGPQPSGDQPSSAPPTQRISQNTETAYRGGPTGVQNLQAPSPCPPQSPPPPPPSARRGRVSCDLCGKSFYDKGTLKIHQNAVHLKVHHGCTVAGCSMVFSSLRSRNRHSANANPRLHAGAVSVSATRQEQAAGPGTASAGPAPSHQRTHHSCRAAPVLPGHRASPPGSRPGSPRGHGRGHRRGHGRGHGRGHRLLPTRCPFLTVAPPEKHEDG